MSSMRFDVKFQERNSSFAAQFGEVHEVSDGGYERGYAEGYEDGQAVGSSRKILDSLIDRSITEISSDVTVIGNYALSNCTALVNVDFPNVKTISGYGFLNCRALTSVAFPKVQGINGYAFSNCTALTDVDIPNVKSIGQYVFRNCPALRRIDLHQTYSIGAYTFYECSNLEAIILRKTDTPCALAAINVLQETKIADGEGYIYVPAALVDKYKAATNWSTYAAQIRAIEDYPEITGGES